MFDIRINLPSFVHTQYISFHESQFTDLTNSGFSMLLTLSIYFATNGNIYRSLSGIRKTNVRVGLNVSQKKGFIMFSQPWRPSNVMINCYLLHLLIIIFENFIICVTDEHNLQKNPTYLHSYFLIEIVVVRHLLLCYLLWYICDDFIYPYVTQLYN